MEGSTLKKKNRSLLMELSGIYEYIFFFLLNIGLICKLHCLELDLRINYKELEK